MLKSNFEKVVLPGPARPGKVKGRPGPFYGSSGKPAILSICFFFRVKTYTNMVEKTVKKIVSEMIG
jgi:hypothetical protein